MKYPVYCCQKCGENIGILGRFLFPFFHKYKQQENCSSELKDARDAIATIIWDAIMEFDAKSTVNVNDYADQILKYMEENENQSN